MGADGAQRVMEAFGELTPNQLSELQQAGKLDTFADSVAKGNWNENTLRRNTNELISG